MKSLINAIVLLSLAACAPHEKFVKLAREVQPKSTMISVSTVVNQLFFEIKDGELTVHQATTTVHILGAGVFVSPTGHILTCAHLFEVGETGKIIVRLQNGESAKAEILFKESQYDLALLKIEVRRPVPYARIADPRSLVVGQEALAVGNPLSFGFTVTHGILSALHRNEVGVEDMTQSDTFINPGNSGGPLFNLKGELIGINSRIVPPVPANIFTGIGFSVSPQTILKFLDRFRGLSALRYEAQN